MLKIFSVFYALLFNSWFEKGSIPREHATAKIMFLFKETPSPKTTIDQLRPIQITSIFFKIIERIIQ